jgi:hypothetical protein
VGTHVSRKACFNCILFCSYFELKTNIRIKLYHNGNEQIELHRRPVQGAVLFRVNDRNWLDADMQLSNIIIIQVAMKDVKMEGTNHSRCRQEPVEIGWESLKA